MEQSGSSASRGSVVDMLLWQKVIGKNVEHCITDTRLPEVHVLEGFDRGPWEVKGQFRSIDSLERASSATPRSTRGAYQ